MAWHLVAGEGVEETGALPGQLVLPVSEASVDAKLASYSLEELADQWTIPSVKGAKPEVGVTDAAVLSSEEDEFVKSLPDLHSDFSAGSVAFVCYWSSLFTYDSSRGPISGSWSLPWLRPEWIGWSKRHLSNGA